MSNELNLRLGIERAICRDLVAELIGHGYHLIWDGGDIELEDLVTTQEAVKLLEGNDGMFNFDEGHLLVYKKAKPEGSDRKADSFVRIIFGNDGWDCINDYGTSLEKHMKLVLALADKCSELPVEMFEQAVTKYAEEL